MDTSRWLEWYRQMVVIRRLEEKAAELYQLGQIGGFLHLYIGQEAVSTGLIAARRPQDRVITAYRDHGVAINCGMEAKVVLAELLGKATGCSKGKGGSMHLADVRLNFWGGHAIVGAHLPLAAGLALADQYKKTDSVTLCMFGDGATNIGYFHEAMNLAKVWDLPMVFACENNQYGMGTALDRASAVTEMRRKADGYGMESARVEDGMDVLAVHQAALQAFEQARAPGHGPVFLEISTYRFRGHSMGDPERYRKADEVKKWQADDPIGRLRANIIAAGLADDPALDALDADVDGEIAVAAQFAQDSPDPALEELWSDIYAEA